MEKTHFRLKLPVSCAALFCTAALVTSCYLANTPPVPNVVGFHFAESPFEGAGEEITGIASDGEIAVAVSRTGKIAYSLDAKIWQVVTDYTGPGITIQYSSVAWGALPEKEAAESPSGGVFLAGGDLGKAAYSYDGIAWTKGVIGPMNPKNINGVAVGMMYGSPAFAAVGDDGRICYAVGSVEGKWNEATLTPYGDADYSGEDVFAVCFGTIKNQEMFVAVGENGKFAYMNDLSGRWYGTRMGTDRTLTSVCYGDDRFVAAGDDGLIKYTNDPRESLWVLSDSSVFNSRPFSVISYDKAVGQYVFVGSDAVVGYSQFGVSWLAATFQARFERGISAVGCTGKRIILGGEDGLIVYSN
ncbi:MAG: hypothetical protein LBN21_07950 [Treponema sp.]|jgi:hypothetical protein|nr:hypothetical protein [Treponema sp.]